MKSKSWGVCLDPECYGQKETCIYTFGGTAINYVEPDHQHYAHPDLDPNDRDTYCEHCGAYYNRPVVPVQPDDERERVRSAIADLRADVANDTLRHVEPVPTEDLRITAEVQVEIDAGLWREPQH